MGLYGLAYLLVQGGVIGAAGEMPERYMQAVVASTTTLWLCVLGLKKEGREQRNNERERERKLELFNKEKLYVYNISTTNSKWQVVTSCYY